MSSDDDRADPAADDAVRAHLDTVTGATRRRDAETLLGMFGRITTEPARLWPGSIIGFGRYHYRYESGREGDAAAAGFSPRKASMSIYFADGLGAYADELARLGPHKTGVGCLYIADLAKVDLAVLEQMVSASYRAVTAGDYYGHRARESEGGRPEPREPE
ncbi:DUF1801 domain-containing protein [Cryobacterium arcticum]|uniref:YdhG-like domain-containing protein n=1 Tax=Cryobacterium arcticum TaxID=670052 RepID=A0A1B1BHD5_9MICO|nr:DUF1801 domain-containing protein [Cryobacterium arcticum]ANP71944.1 hypothetical protein PA27867_0977 [Cryobacterium arcticum]